jgi:hypothetical protein
MPVGKELGNFEAKFTSVRTVEVRGEQVITEGSYMGKVSGELSGTVTGTVTFDGTIERGTISGQSVGYLDAGGVLPGKGQGVYWSDSQGKWQTRAGFVLPEGMMVGEGEITLADGEFTWSGKIYELT